MQCDSRHDFTFFANLDSNITANFRLGLFFTFRLLWRRNELRRFITICLFLLSRFRRSLNRHCLNKGERYRQDKNSSKRSSQWHFKPNYRNSRNDSMSDRPRSLRPPKMKYALCSPIDLRARQA